MALEFSQRFAGAVLAAALVPIAAVQATDETIVVTGTRVPTPLEHLGGAATVISAADIKLHQYRSIADALASVPGLHIAATGGSGAQTSVFIRGTESNHVLVLIDGIEVTDPASGGAFGFEHLQLNNVERIEVLRGPYSALYGSEGIGGVINIVTQRGEGAPQASARVEIGSFGTAAASVNLSGRHDRVDFSLGSAWLQTDGESFTPRRLRGGHGGEDDGYDNFDIKGALGVELSEVSRLDFNFAYANADVEYDGDVDLDGDFLPDQFETTPRDSVYEKRYGMHWSGDYLQGAWRPSLHGTYYSRQSNSPGVTRRGERTKFEWRNDLFFSDAMKFTVGAETELEKARTTGSASDTARTKAVYLQAWFEPLEALSLSAGWRNDDADDFGSDRNWQLAAAYAFSESGVRLRASYGTAFKAPTLSERFGAFGNPDLDPETSRSREFGIEQTVSVREPFSYAGWGVTYFDNRIRDLITFDLGELIIDNIAGAHTEGVESFVSLDTAAGLSLRLDYTLMRARDNDHERLLRRPLRKAGFSARWSDPAWSLTAKLDYIGPQRDFRRDNPSPCFRPTPMCITRGGYTLAHITMRRRLNDEFALFARVNNLLDRDYEPVDGYAGGGLGFHAGVEVGL